MKNVLAWICLIFLNRMAFGVTGVKHQLHLTLDSWVNARTNCLPGQLTRLPESNLSDIAMSKGDVAWINVQEYVSEDYISKDCCHAQIEYRSPEELFGVYANRMANTGTKGFTRAEVLKDLNSDISVTIRNIRSIIKVIPGTGRFWIKSVDFSNVSSLEIRCLAMKQEGDNHMVMVADDCTSQHFYICETGPDVKVVEPTIRRIRSKTKKLHTNIINATTVTTSVSESQTVLVAFAGIVSVPVAVFVTLCFVVFIKRKRDKNKMKRVQADMNDTHQPPASHQVSADVNVDVLPVREEERDCNDSHGVLFHHDENTTEHAYSHIMLNSLRGFMKRE